MFLRNIFLFCQLIFVTSHVSEDSVQFLFYGNNETVQVTSEILDNLNINAQKPVKVLIHGLAGNSSVEWYKSIREAYLTMGYNVFATDWTIHAYSGYLKAILASRDIGYLIGKFIIDIKTVWNIPLQDMHVIGHSLGAHIAGFTGKYVLRNSSKKIGRITGLDPAGPLHNYLSNGKRLCDEDADLVDVIHTNAGVLGITSSIGHMDFYPDGGTNQNKCKAEMQCNHEMAPKYFTDSISGRRFEAVLCDSYINYTLGYCEGNVKSFMGEDCQFNARGDYFLTTGVM